MNATTVGGQASNGVSGNQKPPKNEEWAAAASAGRLDW